MNGHGLTDKSVMVLHPMSNFTALSIVITLATASYQAIHAAMASPVKSLDYFGGKHFSGI